MEQQLLPLFPLNVVLFPRTPLPLHIFEDRYKEMIGEAIEANTEFGVVLAGEKGIVNTGCTAVIEKVLKKYDDGRMDVLASGRRRFEILLLNDDKSYLRGAVEYFDDEAFDPIPPGVKERVIEGYNDLCQIDPPEPLLDPELADSQLSFQLAQALPDLNFRQMLLATRSESERMKRLAEFLPTFNSRQRHIAHVKAVAPHNGHGKWPSSP
jgi:Lon protease-like protein